MKDFSIFVEAMRRLYRDGNINEEKVIFLFDEGKITEEEKNYILAL